MGAYWSFTRTLVTAYSTRVDEIDANRFLMASRIPLEIRCPSTIRLSLAFSGFPSAILCETVITTNISEFDGMSAMVNCGFSLVLGFTYTEYTSRELFSLAQLRFNAFATVKYRIGSEEIILRV